VIVFILRTIGFFSYTAVMSGAYDMLGITPHDSGGLLVEYEKDKTQGIGRGVKR